MNYRDVDTPVELTSWWRQDKAIVRNDPFLSSGSPCSQKHFYNPLIHFYHLEPHGVYTTLPGFLNPTSCFWVTHVAVCISSVSTCFVCTCSPTHLCLRDVCVVSISELVWEVLLCTFWGLPSGGVCAHFCWAHSQVRDCWVMGRKYVRTS